MPDPRPQKTRLVLVTGLSGAGKSSALKILEDFGFEVVDNLPLHLVRRLVATTDASPDHHPDRPVAIGVDVRTRAFTGDSAAQQIEQLRGQRNLDISLLYFDCDEAELARRYTETRRRHPLAQDRPVADGIARETMMMAPLRAIADLVIDTSMMPLRELRRRLGDAVATARPRGMTLTLMSFGFAHGLPRDADMVFDMRFLRNPHYDAKLQPLTGADPEVAAYIAADPDYARSFGQVRDLILGLLPRYVAEGKSYLTVAIGCTGGKHRSVFVATELAKVLESAGYPVNIVHRDVEREKRTGL